MSAAEEELKQLQQEERESRIDDEVERRSQEVETARLQVKEAREEMRAVEEKARADRDAALAKDAAQQQTIEALRRELSEGTALLDARASIDQLDNKCTVLQRQYQSALAEAESLRGSEQSLVIALDKERMDQTATMRCLQAELDSVRATEASRVKAAEAADNNAEKNAILLKLVQDQLSHKETDLDFTKAQLQNTASDLRRAEEKLIASIGETNELRDGIRKRANEVKLTARAQEEAAADLAQKLAESTSQLADARKEVDEAKARLFEVLSELRHREQVLGKVEADGKVKIRKLEGDLAEARRRHERDNAEAKERIGTLTEDCGLLRALLEKERATRGALAAETGGRIAKLEQDLDTALLRCAQMEGQVKSSQSDNTHKVVTLLNDTSRLQQQLDISTASFRDMEQMKDREITTLTAQLEAAKAASKQQAEEAESREQKHNDETLSTWHAKETYKRQTAATAKDLERVKGEFKNYKLAAETQLQLANKRHHDALLDHRGRQTALMARVHKLDQELACVSDQLSQTAERGRAAGEQHAQLAAETNARAAAHAAEIDGYKASIAKLEAEVASTRDHAELAMENQKLADAVSKYRNQVKSLNHTISTGRIESGIIENQKIRALQKSHEASLQRLSRMHGHLDTARQLLGDAVPVLGQCGEGVYLKSRAEDFMTSLTSEADALSLLPTRRANEIT
ncbi:hypothetical protein DIPPA_23592 [Diplonema papillatum]|nr:hypothetical protein DIPPA_23592 [Diplonema papillatum]